MTRRRSVKSWLYLGLRVSNDLNAVKRGTVGKRLARRVVGKATGRAMGRFLR